MVQEGPRGGMDADLVAHPLHVEPVEGADRAVGLAFGGAEGREIVAADEVCAASCILRIERPGHVPDPVHLEWPAARGG